MKVSLPLLLLLPLHAAFAQMRPTYSAPRPGYTPAPLYHPSTSNYQTQQRTQQQAHQTFQQMQSQQRQQMQDRYYYNNRAQSYRLTRQQSIGRGTRPEQELANQQQAAQKATEQLAQLSQAQQHRRQEHPAADAQQAAAQQLADAKELTVLRVKTYREVFLPGQMRSVLQSLLPTNEAKQQLQAVSSELLDKAWWGQEGAPAKVAAHGHMLVTLTTDLLGFDAASPVTAPLAASTLDAMLAQDTFDQAVAGQLLQTAGQREKRVAGAALFQAVQAFQALSAQVAATPNLKRQRKEVQKSLLRVNKELARYSAQVGNSGDLAQAQEAILTSTASYLAKNGG